MASCVKKIIEFQHGDIIAMLGNGWFSKYFASISKYDQRFSHVGIISIDKISDKKNYKINVIHAEADELSGVGFVKKQSLEVFLRESRRFGIFRLNFSESEKRKMVDRAELFAKNKTPFDFDFRLDDLGKSVYCTELIWLSIIQATQTEFFLSKTKMNQKEIISIEDIIHHNKYHKNIDIQEIYDSQKN